jgi:hypothetical protein
MREICSKENIIHQNTTEKSGYFIFILISSCLDESYIGTLVSCFIKIRQVVS